MSKSFEYSSEVLDVAKVAKALSHPVRAYIIKKLSGMNSCCYSGDLADELPVGRSTLSQHLKELKYAGLIQGEVEPPFIKYCLNRENWAKVQLLFEGYFQSAAKPENHSETIEVINKL